MNKNRCQEKLAARNYELPEDRMAFEAGYLDGFNGFEMWSSIETAWHPDSYRAGYLEGVEDGKDDA